MRPYRAKRKDNGEWIEESFAILRRKDWDGEKWNVRYFLQDGYSCNETPKIENFIEVIPDTVSQSTSLKDKNGKEIWEGDIVVWGKYKRVWVVVFNEKMAGWYMQPIENFSTGKDEHGQICKLIENIFGGRDKTAEVIGNIHDNPKGAENE